MPEPTDTPLPVYCTGGCDACRDVAMERGVPLIAGYPAIKAAAFPTPPAPEPGADAAWEAKVFVREAFRRYWLPDADEARCVEIALGGLRAAALARPTPALDVTRDPDGRLRTLLTEAIAAIESAPFAHEKLTDAQVILDGLRIEFGGPPYRLAARATEGETDR